MAKEQSQLTPEQQRLAFLLAQQRGQQPVNGGQPMAAPDPAAQMGVGQVNSSNLQALFGQQAPAQMPAPGSFRDNPQGAMEFIAKFAQGQQLGRNQQGQLTMAREQGPLSKLFGMQPKQDPLIDQTNYFRTAQESGLTDLLPTGLPRTPEGEPFVSDRVLDNARQARMSKKDVLKDPFIGQWGATFLKQAGSPEQVEAWNRLTPEAQASLVSNLPGFRTARQAFFSPQGIVTDAGGQPSGVTFNAKTGEYEVKPLPTSGAIPAKGRAATSEENDFFAKAETLNSVLGEVARLYSDDKVGPFAGRIGRAVDVYTPFTNEERSSLRNNVAKMFNNMVYLRSGKQINQEEAIRMAEEFMNINNTPGAFKSAFDSFQNEFVWLVDNRREALKQGLVANADRFAPRVKRDERVQLNGTQAVDSFLTQYDKKNKTNYSQSVRDETEEVVQFLKSQKAKVTPANLKAAKEFLSKQKGK